MIFNTKFAKSQSKYNRCYISEKIDDYSLFQKYVGNFKIRHAICSPIRNDKIPSFVIFLTKEGKAMYHDHATGESGDIYKFLKELWNLPLKKIYKRIVDELDITVDSKLKKPTKKDILYVAKTIEIKRKPFSSSSTYYWDTSYGISQDTLVKHKVFPIYYYTINGILQEKWEDANPLFAYKVFDQFKIYRPLAEKEKKWKGTLTKDCIFGFEQLPDKGDLLIITKSLKDVMVLYELKYTAIAPPAESVEISQEIIKNLESRFKRIIVFFDYDNAGIKFSKKIATDYGLKEIFLDPKTEAKDISDYLEKFGKEKTKNKMIDLINDKKENH